MPLIKRPRLNTRQVAAILGYSVKSVSCGSGVLASLTVYQVRPGAKRQYDPEQVEQLRQSIQPKVSKWRE